MIQILNLIGEVVDRNSEGGITVQVHTYYVTSEDLVVRDALVVLYPSEHLRGAMFDKLVQGNLIFAQGVFEGNEYGNPFISPDDESVFTVTVDNLQLLSDEAYEKRGSDLFQIIMIGNLGRDAETRYKNDGGEFYTGSMAVNTKVGEEDKTVWFKVTSWIASKLRYMKKGQRAFIVGTPAFDPETGSPRTWEAQDGGTRASYEINVRRLVPMQKVEVTEEDDYGYDEPEDIPF